VDRIQSNLLNDTLNLVQLARETARMQGSQSKAEKLSPVVNQLQTLVTNGQTRKPAESGGIMAQSDFKELLQIPQAKLNQSTSATLNERNQIISSMALGGMNDIDIARQMGMTRDEIRMFLNLNPGNASDRR
jgi:DNA-binding NarL/FixJ family response regulator